MHEKVIAAIPQDTSDHMLEVVFIDDQAQGPRVELRTLAWHLTPQRQRATVIPFPGVPPRNATPAECASA